MKLIPVPTLFFVVLAANGRLGQQAIVGSFLADFIPSNYRQKYTAADLSTWRLDSITSTFVIGKLYLLRKLTGQGDLNRNGINETVVVAVYRVDVQTGASPAATVVHYEWVLFLFSFNSSVNVQSTSSWTRVCENERMKPNSIRMICRFLLNQLSKYGIKSRKSSEV